MTDPAGSTDPADVVVIGAARTPFTRLNGALAALPATTLGGHAIAAALAQAQIDGAGVNAVFLGQVLQAGAGQNPARQAALAGGVGPQAHASAVNKVCLSGLSAVVDATRLIRSGEAEVVVAGGMESMSQAPHLLPGTRAGWPYGDRTAIDHLAYDGLTDALDAVSMGELTERGAAVPAGTDLSRTAQDAWAARSHQRAEAATRAGTFAAEIAPVRVRSRNGETEVSRDEGIRPGSTAETLVTLRPAFRADGAITAGNASQLTDGAALAAGGGLLERRRCPGAGVGARLRPGGRPGQQPAPPALPRDREGPGPRRLGRQRSGPGGDQRSLRGRGAGLDRRPRPAAGGGEPQWRCDRSGTSDRCLRCSPGGPSGALPAAGSARGGRTVWWRRPG